MYPLLTIIYPGIYVYTYIWSRPPSLHPTMGHYQPQGGKGEDLIWGHIYIYTYVRIYIYIYYVVYKAYKVYAYLTLLNITYRKPI